MKKWMVWMVAGVLITGCATNENKKALMGTGLGALAGAGVGTIIGHQSGNRDKGAAIGGVLGAGIGAGIGHKMDQQAAELAKVEAVNVKRAEDGSIIASMKSNILFGVGSSALQSASLNSINQMSDVLKQYPENRVVVLGHTDNQGSSSSNQQLSERRAQAVRAQMLVRGVPSTSVEAVGQGEASPVASNDNEEGRTQNRRVELRISADPTKAPQQ